MWNQKPCFRFEINNLSKKKAAIKSKVFASGGCEWYLNLHPKGDGHVSLYLCVAKPKSLGRGWERSAKFYFLLLNQSDKEVYKSPIGKKRSVFCAKNPDWGFSKTLPLGKFQEKGFLDKDRLIIKVYIKVLKAFDGVGLVSETKTMDINGFQSQVPPVRKIFSDLAEDFKPKNQVAKSVNLSLQDFVKLQIDEDSLRLREEYRLLQLSKNKEPKNFHFKGYVDKRMKKRDGSRVQQRVEDVSLESQKTDDSDGSRVQELEERVKNIEVMESSFKMDCLKSKLEEVSLEKKKSGETERSRVQQVEERVKNLEQMELSFKLDYLKSKLEERKMSNDADGSRVQQLEERLKNLELLVLDLKFELDKEKAKSCDDGFLLV